MESSASTEEITTGNYPSQQYLENQDSFSTVNSYFSEEKDLPRVVNAVLANLDHCFKNVIDILSEHTFEEKHHPILQDLWYQAHYKEQEAAKGRKLSYVTKYRLRKKYPLPKGIWDGEERVYCFKQSSRETLKKAYTRNCYPSPEEKKDLSSTTGLTMTQVKNWLKNRRLREKEKERRSGLNLFGSHDRDEESLSHEYVVSLLDLSSNGIKMCLKRSDKKVRQRSIILSMKSGHSLSKKD